MSIVGGPTGSGKTAVLHALRDDLNAQVLDLEGEANHRGSIFGALGRPAQPSNEQYESSLEPTRTPRPTMTWHDDVA